VRARELEDFDFADDQRVIGGACRESMARDSRKERERGARAQVRKEVSTSHALLSDAKGSASLACCEVLVEEHGAAERSVGHQRVLRHGAHALPTAAFVEALCLGARGIQHQQRAAGIEGRTFRRVLHLVLSL